MKTTRTTPRQPWIQPQLIVLVRSRPEEAVLGSCKYISTSGSPNGADGECVIGDPCQSCDTYESS